MSYFYFYLLHIIRLNEKKKKTWFANENVYQFIFIQQNKQNLELKSKRNRFVSINWPCFLKD